MENKYALIGGKMLNHLVFTDNLPDIKSCDVDYLFEVAEYFFRLSITARREGILAFEDYFSGDTWKNCGIEINYEDMLVISYFTY